MKKIEDKLEKLEEVIKDDFEWGSTQIDPKCLTETEKKFFSHFDQLNPHTIFNRKDMQLTDKDVNLVNKCLFYGAKRVLDLFMGFMNLQLMELDAQFIFWCRFIDFISETMYIINRNYGIDFVLHMRFGENVDEWPEEDDPAWKEFEEWENRWEHQFKKFWNQISLTAEKLVSNMGTPPADRGYNNECVEIDMTKNFGEIVSVCLTRPSKPEIAILAFVSSMDPEFMDKILEK